MGGSGTGRGPPSKNGTKPIPRSRVRRRSLAHALKRARSAEPRSQLRTYNRVMTQRDDAELWAEVIEGDPEAFGQLFERHARRVYNHCFRHTADWARAEDLTSIVFLECWRRRDAAVDPHRVLPWLLGIATNVCRNERRSLVRHRAALRCLPPPEQTFDVGEDTMDRLDDERRMRDVIDRVSHLPERDRDVLALCVWGGLSYEDAAAALSVPIGTIRSRLARARSKLRAQDWRDSTRDDEGGAHGPGCLAERGVENDAR
jgi:RNA polymerase sigma factor (sigma-70 family)